jgi:hypothetical protein
MQIAFYKGKGDWKDSLIRYTTNSNKHQHQRKSTVHARPIQMIAHAKEKVSNNKNQRSQNVHARNHHHNKLESHSARVHHHHNAHDQIHVLYLPIRRSAIRM